MPGPIVNLRNLSTGRASAMPLEEAQAFINAQPASWAIETPTQTAEAVTAAQVRQDFSSPLDKAAVLAGETASGLTVGLSDLAVGALASDEGRDEYNRQREANSGYALAGNIGGTVVGALASGGAGLLSKTPAAAISRAGSAIARTGEGAGVLGRVGAAAAGAGVEGAIYGAGQGVSDVALADDPVTMERLAGSVGHHALYGGAIGAAAGGGLTLLGAGLGAARRRLTASRDALEAKAGGEVAEDLAALDAKGLAAAREAEEASIEAARVPQRQALADEVAAYRQQAMNDKPWNAVATGGKGKANKAAIKKLTKAADEAEAEAIALEAKAARSGNAADAAAASSARDAATAARETAETTAAGMAASQAPQWMRATGAKTLKFDRALDGLLDDPKALSGLAGDRAFNSATSTAAANLRKQEAALQNILDHADELKILHATDQTGRRAAALDTVQATLERNKQLQARIAELTAAPSSDRLKAIANAAEALKSSPAKTLGQQMATGTTYGVVSDLVRQIPIIGPVAAPLVASRVADAIGSKLSPKLLAATKAATERTIRVVDALTTATKVAGRAAPKAAPVLASQVLEGARFTSSPSPAPAPTGRARPRRLEDHFKARSQEIASLVEPTPTGPQVRSGVRAQIADRLSGLAFVAPHVADRLETHAVKRIEFLAARMPKPMQIGMTEFPPDELAMRSWARLVAAADDPGGIEERLLDGTVTPEDAEVMRALYPGRLADLTQRIMENGADRLPYHRRLALSVLTGAPIDAAMDPAILSGLQATFAKEPNTEGGTEAPRPKAAFGSVKRPEPTPAQRRAG